MDKAFWEMVIVWSRSVTRGTALFLVAMRPSGHLGYSQLGFDGHPVSPVPLHRNGHSATGPLALTVAGRKFFSATDGAFERLLLVTQSSLSVSPRLTEPLPQKSGNPHLQVPSYRWA